MRVTYNKITVLDFYLDTDFNTVLNAFLNKNEPKPMPNSMGAAMIKGFNNWSRINALKEKWLNKNPFGDWSAHFMKNIVPQKALYQDKFIVLSTKEYSGVFAEDLGLSICEWKQLSVQIRLAHECVHYFTHKYYGLMSNNMHDELIADYMGIRKAKGAFDLKWFLKFIGLEKYPMYRKGARFENYLGNPPLSKAAFEMVRTIVKKAAKNIAAFDQKLACSSNESSVIRALCSMSLLEMACNGAEDTLYAEYKVIEENRS